MSVPTSPALSAAREAFEQHYGSALWMWEMRRDLSDLLRLQHEASTASRTVVFDLDRYRRLASGVHDDDPEAA